MVHIFPLTFTNDIFLLQLENYFRNYPEKHIKNHERLLDFYQETFKIKTTRLLKYLINWFALKVRRNE